MASGASSDIRVFTLEEANALVPTLSRLVGEQLDLGERIQRSVAELVRSGGSVGSRAAEAARGEVLDITVQVGDSDEVRKRKRELGRMIGRYRQGWREVQDLGVVVKDTSTGLLDFYGKVDGRLVWLCWKYGEDGVDFYHELDTGFAGRKPLADVRRRMLN
jgi:hypothetical protein